MFFFKESPKMISQSTSKINMPFDRKPFFCQDHKQSFNNVLV